MNNNNLVIIFLLILAFAISTRACAASLHSDGPEKKGAQAKEETGILHNVVEKAEAVKDWVGEKLKGTGHAVNEEISGAQRNYNTQKAMDSELPLKDRAQAAGEAIKYGANEFVEAGKKNLENAKADADKNKFMNTETNRNFETEHGARQAEFKEQRVRDTEKVLDSDAPIKDRVQAAGNVIKEGANELKEAAQDAYQQFVN